MCLPVHAFVEALHVQDVHTSHYVLILQDVSVDENKWDTGSAEQGGRFWDTILPSSPSWDGSGNPKGELWPVGKGPLLIQQHLRATGAGGRACKSMPHLIPGCPCALARPHSPAREIGVWLESWLMTHRCLGGTIFVFLQSQNGDGSKELPSHPLNELVHSRNSRDILRTVLTMDLALDENSPVPPWAQVVTSLSHTASSVKWG